MLLLSMCLSAKSEANHTVLQVVVKQNVEF